jgi:hypothetical protein
MFIIGVLLLAVVFILIVIGLEKGKTPGGGSGSGTTRGPGVDKNSKPGQPV